MNDKTVPAPFAAPTTARLLASATDPLETASQQLIVEASAMAECNPSIKASTEAVWAALSIILVLSMSLKSAEGQALACACRGTSLLQTLGAAVDALQLPELADGGVWLPYTFV